MPPKTAEKPSPPKPKPPKPPKPPPPASAISKPPSPSITKAYGDGSIMRLGDAQALQQDRGHPHRRAGRGPGAGRRRLAARARGRDLRAGILRQNDADAARHRQCPEGRRAGGVHRCRARAGSGLRQEAGREPGRPAGVPAGQRRRSADHLRNAGPLQCAGCDRHRFRRRAGAQGGTGRRDGHGHDGHAGAADEPGAAQAHRHSRQGQDHLRLHQPDAREGRRHVRQSGDHARAARR